jgi:riboflavin synthase
MFTGIIKKTAKVKDAKTSKNGMFLEIENKLEKVKLGLPAQAGESISVNGVCSTIKKIGKIIQFEYMPESLKLSNLGSLKKNDLVNLEQSMRMGDRLDGHIILGHIDGKGKIISIKKEGNSKAFEIKLSSKQFGKLLVYKGSVAIEGISLTVAKIVGQNFLVKILPYTLEHTNLKFKKVGDAVNLEFDILAKYANKK